MTEWGMPVAARSNLSFQQHLAKFDLAVVVAMLQPTVDDSTPQTGEMTHRTMLEPATGEQAGDSDCGRASAGRR
jgi:hypothetical protein